MPVNDAEREAAWRRRLAEREREAQLELQRQRAREAAERFAEEVRQQVRPSIAQQHRDELAAEEQANVAALHAHAAQMAAQYDREQAERQALAERQRVERETAIPENYWDVLSREHQSLAQAARERTRLATMPRNDTTAVPIPPNVASGSISGRLGGEVRSNLFEVARDFRYHDDPATPRPRRNTVTPPDWLKKQVDGAQTTLAELAEESGKKKARAAFNLIQQELCGEGERGTRVNWEKEFNTVSERWTATQRQLSATQRQLTDTQRQLNTLRTQGEIQARAPLVPPRGRQLTMPTVEEFWNWGASATISRWPSIGLSFRTEMERIWTLLCTQLRTESERLWAEEGVDVSSGNAATNATPIDFTINGTPVPAGHVRIVNWRRAGRGTLLGGCDEPRCRLRWFNVDGTSRSWQLPYLPLCADHQADVYQAAVIAEDTIIRIDQLPLEQREVLGLTVQAEPATAQHMVRIMARTDGGCGNANCGNRIMESPEGLPEGIDRTAWTLDIPACDTCRIRHRGVSNATNGLIEENAVRIVPFDSLPAEQQRILYMHGQGPVSVVRDDYIDTVELEEEPDEPADGD